MNATMLKNGVVVDFETPENSTVRLTRTELELFRVLVLNTGRVLSSKKLYATIGGFYCKHRRTSVPMLISNLRRKLNTDQIATSYGRGYVFTFDSPKPKEPPKVYPGDVLGLTPREYALYLIFQENPREVLSLETLAALVGISRGAVQGHVRHLKVKLHSNWFTPQGNRIVTKRKEGYLYLPIRRRIGSEPEFVGLPQL